MKYNPLLSVVWIIILILVAACGNISEQSYNNQSSNSSSTSENDSSNKELKNKDNGITEADSEDGGTTELHDKEASSDHSSTNKSHDAMDSSNSHGELAESKKNTYLKKLNEMEDADRNSEVGTSILELEAQEAERYQNWDEALNDIYGVLKEQLSTEEMDKLKEEQRNWIRQRDESAKEASLKYEGRATESLEYIAAQASLTKERCYLLVAKYMK